MGADTTDCRRVERVPPTDEQTISGRWVVVGLVGLAAAFVLYLAAGMPGMSHSSGEMRDMEHQSTTGAEP